MIRDLPNLLRGQRLANGLTLEQVAARSGHSRSAIQAWELGKSLPSFDSLQDVLPVYGMQLVLEPAPVARSGPDRRPAGLDRAQRVALRRHRKQRGLTQKQVADELGVSVRAVAAWEAGRRDPNRDQFQRWFAFLAEREANTA